MTFQTLPFSIFDFFQPPRTSPLLSQRETGIIQRMGCAAAAAAADVEVSGEVATTKLREGLTEEQLADIRSALASSIPFN